MYYVIRCTWKDIILIIYYWIVFFTIKSPLGSLISSIIPYPIVKYVLPMLWSFLVTEVASKIFKDLVNKMKSHDYFLNACIIDTVISFIKNIFNRLGFKYELCSMDSKGSPLEANWINDPLLKIVSPSPTPVNNTPTLGQLLKMRGDIAYGRIQRLETAISGLKMENPNNPWIPVLGWPIGIF